ncbi:MAG TPA: DoxX family protein [Puia sp.]|nr:DoxX family protein [Puia sp.]
MNSIQKLNRWGDRHHPKIIDVIRMLVGVLLIIKGYVYFNNAGYIREDIIQYKLIRQSPEVILAIIYYTTYIQLVGGAMIFLGLSTRIASICVLPVIIGAVFFVNVLDPYFNSELWLSILVLALLLLFIIEGSGTLSLDYLLSDFKKTGANKN